MGQECKGRVPGILILTHGRAGIELIESSNMILGEMEGVYGEALLPGMSPEEFTKKVRTRLDSMPKGSLIMVDIFGGTPCNVSIMLSEKYNCSVISGINLAMIIEAVTSREYLSNEELVQTVERAGAESCKDAIKYCNRNC